MILFTIINQREETIILRYNYFHCSDSFYNYKQKRTGKKLAWEIFQFVSNLLISKPRRNKQYICAKNTFIRMILFTIINKKEQAINLRQKYFHSYDCFTIINKKGQAINLREKYFHSNDNFYINKQKETSNKFATEIFSFVWYFLQK